MNRHFWKACLPVILIALVLAACGEKEQPAPAAAGSAGAAAPAGKAEAVVLHLNIDPIGKGLALNEALAAEYEKQTGVKVELIKGPIDATERLSQYLQYLGAQSPDIDIYQIDVIWPGILAEHFTDLSEPLKSDLPQFFPSIVKNNTVNGKLVCIPWFGDAGILYYRKDLLEQYGFAAPPAAWDELETMSKKIQEGERAAGNKDFWGFVWQGKAFECLTCDGIEWQVSHGGGSIVEPDRRVSINNPKAIAAFKRAAAWVGTISPPGVTTYAEEEARQLFQTGNAAFMRNWPYAYALCNADDSGVKGKIDVTLLPDAGGGHAAALGGWQLGVAKYSKHQKEAIEYVRWLTSRDIQKRRAIEAALLPTRIELYDDAELATAIPFLPRMKDVFLSASPRPSTVAGESYNEVSTIYFMGVHQILTGEATAEDAVKNMESQLRGVLE
ncbi:ABC transporter substrate-binding protein [Candidatus Poribacteria bacterium]|nr:ABC transporter substrate-binding protein [Candidatus Poribacteria bacterium]